MRREGLVRLLIMDAAAAAGITFFDTADVYPLGGTVEVTGRTEEIVGKWLRGRRDQFIVATKCSGKMGHAAWQQGTSRKHVLEAIDASLSGWAPTMSTSIRFTSTIP